MNDYTRTAVHTDKGLRHGNQDALIVIAANSDIGKVTLAAVCDGMGGLKQGEVASAKMVNALHKWFTNSLAAAICNDGAMIPFEDFCSQMDDLVNQTAKDIDTSSEDRSGTTMTAILIAAGRFYTANVGDSRIYMLHDGRLSQLTKDQTLVQRKIDTGVITEEEALTDPERNILLQCVGSCDSIQPEYTKGECRAGDSFLLCSDGFRHKITAEEIANEFRTDPLDDEQQDEKHMRDILIRLTESCKARGEKDNITSVWIRLMEGSRFC